MLAFHKNLRLAKLFPRRQQSSWKYESIILKKFIFHIHPDFFQHHKSEQSINAENLKILMAKSDADSGRTTPIQANTRSLTFYIKPSESEDSPRRVKVTLSRIVESMREVLETIGVELPAAPEGTSTTTEFVSTVGETDFRIFLDSLLDR